MKPGNKAINLFLPRIQDVLFVATLCAAFLLGPRMLHIDSDLGRHLTLGEHILSTKTIPTADILSHTLSGFDRPPYEWLTQVIFALAHRFAKLDGIILVVSLIIAVTFSFIYSQASKRSGLPLTSLILTILALAASSLHWLPRPHVMTFLFLAILLERLEELHIGKSVPIWHFPLLMLAWVNLHGGFVFGFLVWLAYLVGWAWEKWIIKSNPNENLWRNLWIGFLLSGVASLITPDAWGSWKAVLNNRSQYILSQTLETMPVNFTQLSAWPFLFLLFLSIVFLYGARKQIQASQVFLLAGMAFLGLLMARNIPLFAIAAAFILPMWARESFRTWNKYLLIEGRITALQKPLYGVILSVLLGLGFAIFIGGRQAFKKGALFHFSERVFPVQAAEWVEKNPQTGNMFNELNWGGYLLYRLWPTQRVFLDSQTDFYGEVLVQEYQTALSREWHTVFDTYNVEWVLLSRNAQLVNRLVEANWEKIYIDETAIILRADTAP